MSPRSAELVFQTLAHDDQAGSELPVEAVVQSQAHWEALGLRAEVEAPDFTRFTVLVVALGQTPDLSQRVRIQAVVDLEARLGVPVAYVLYERTEDGPPLEAIGYPAHIVHLPKSAHHFVFARR